MYQDFFLKRSSPLPLRYWETGYFRSSDPLCKICKMDCTLSFSDKMIPPYINTEVSYTQSCWFFFHFSKEPLFGKALTPGLWLGKSHRECLCNHPQILKWDKVRLNLKQFNFVFRSIKRIQDVWSILWAERKLLHVTKMLDESGARSSHSVPIYNDKIFQHCNK